MVSRTAISESLDKIVYGPNTISAKLTTTLITKVFYDMRDAFISHPYLALGSVVMILLAAYSWFRGRVKRSRGQGHFRLDDGLGSLKDGLLGGNTNGMTKAD
jgi:protein disulfide-isomerase